MSYVDAALRHAEEMEAEGQSDRNDRADLVPDWSSDMDAAPRDGTRVLLFVSGYGAMTGHFDERWHLHSCINKEARPTHWMPLPAPPKGNK